jgi:hypothetical protein
MAVDVDEDWLVVEAGREAMVLKLQANDVGHLGTL